MTEALTEGESRGRIAIKKRDNHVRNFDRSEQDVSFPESHDGPTRFLENPSLLAIALDVTLNLRDPVRGVVSSGELRKPTLQIAAVPEVSIAEDRNVLLDKNDVRTAG